MKAFTTAILCALLALLAAHSANAQLVIIVSAKNSNTSMSLSTADKIFLSKVRLFPDASRAIPFDLPKSEDRDAFYDKVAGKNASQIRAYWSRVVFTGSGAPPKEVDSPEAMVRQVADDPSAVGYVQKSFVNKSVKILRELN